MGFKPMALSLLSGDSPKEALKNAIGETSVVGKLWSDREKEKADEIAKAAEEAKALQAAKAARYAQAGGQGMKKGGSVKKMADGGTTKVPQDIDGASATRSPKKGEKPVYEEPGSGILVDGKPLNKAKGGMVSSSASRRADGCCTKGKTRGKVL